MNAEIKLNVMKSLNKGLRYDGRKLDQYRDVTLEYGVVNNAEGSARVKMGNTEVIAGVKMIVDKPYPDKPNEGTMMIGAELLPLSSPKFEPGPPGIQAIEIARVVDRGIREAEAIDTKSLCIAEGEKVWIVSVDICTINDDGNLFDASALATLAAISDAKFPEYDEETGVDYQKLTDKKVPLTKMPISVTVLKIGKHLIVDPLPEEESVFDARLSVAVLEDGTLCAMQKGGDMPLKIEVIDKMIEFAKKKSADLRSKL